PDPPEEPPALRSGFHGFTVDGKTWLEVSACHPNSGELVLPTTMQPAARRRATWAESCMAAGSPACSAEPLVVVYPVTSSTSFTASGTPARGPTSSPAATRRSISA